MSELPRPLALALRLCPEADERVAARLWRERRWRKLLNYLWVEFLLARGSARLWGGKPYWLTIDPTNFCQLHCPFCPTGADRGVRDKASMSLAHFEKIMRVLGPAAVHLDLMNWGESLLHKDLPEMIACAKRHGVEVRLDANLNDVSEAALERLILSGLDVLSASMDGLSPETYGRYRAGGSFEKALGNLRALIRKRRELGRANPWIIWQFLVFRHNEHEVERVEAFAREVGVDQVGLTPASLPDEPAYLWEWMARDERFRRYALPASEPPAERRESARSAAHVKKTPSSLAFHARRFDPKELLTPRRLLDALRWQDLPALAARIRAVRAQAERPAAAAGSAGRRVCKWPWAGVAVNPNGSVSPCCSVEDQSDDLGNVFTQSWSSLWSGSAYRRARRHVRRYVRGETDARPGSSHVCERCTIIGRANFQFPIKAEKAP